MSNPREAFESTLLAQRVADRVAAKDKVFPVGAAVLIDGRYKAKIVQAFPEGSSSYGFPHYKVNIVGGDKNVAVKMDRVKVKSAAIKVADSLDDKELIALGILTTLKSGYRAKELRGHDIGYTAEDPTLASLIKKGLVKVQGKSLIPDQDKARDAMSKHKRPAAARDWPASFGPRKTKSELHNERMQDNQRAWDHAMGRK